MPRVFGTEESFGFFLRYRGIDSVPGSAMITRSKHCGIMAYTNGRPNHPVRPFSANLCACLISFFSRNQPGRLNRHQEAAGSPAQVPERSYPAASQLQCHRSTNCHLQFLVPRSDCSRHPGNDRGLGHQAFCRSENQVELEDRRIHGRCGTATLPTTAAAEPQERMPHVGEAY